MDGTRSGTQINYRLTTNLSDLFNPDFFERLKNGGEQEFREALIANSIGYDDWVPTIPVRLYHGTADEIVPYSNSEKVYELLNSKGATNLELKKINGGTHGSTLIPMIQSLVPWFEQLQGDKT
jgi:pimeloyl-ACP methyl ester carboxylesterase